MKDYMNVSVMVNGHELLNFHMDRENTEVNVDVLKINEVINALRFVAGELEKDLSNPQ
ncbi:hypothetical protein PQZ66_gp23 [Klebsiella phage vB_KleM_KB2]|jgi:hypothetical protein|uniref:hypothetical protein n=1 Tax=Klebsiella phage vB_KleM_KB2 TaxID=2759197 RepID=UPI002069250D|nr:hypothetical protein PQZ66_gp23 [Klebsiella phage vB_KleM_KB2]DAE76753.1 MAG TPA: hypothetical protein [Caudoviricetes sp.]